MIESGKESDEPYESETNAHHLHEIVEDGHVLVEVHLVGPTVLSVRTQLYAISQFFHSPLLFNDEGLYAPDTTADHQAVAVRIDADDHREPLWISVG